MHFSSVLLNSELGLFEPVTALHSQHFALINRLASWKCSLAFAASALALALTDEIEDWRDDLDTELLPSSSIRFSLNLGLLSVSIFRGLLLVGYGAESVVWGP